MVDKSQSAEAMSDKQVAKTEESSKGKTTSSGEYRDSNMEYLKQMNPGMEITDENYVPAIEKTFSEIAPKMDSYNRANEKFKTMMQGEPILQKVVSDVAQGASFVETLPRYLDISNLEPKPGDPDYIKWEENNARRQSEYKQAQERQAQIKDNEARSMETIKKFFGNIGLADEDQKNFAKFIIELMDRAYSGEITETFLNKMYHAWKYDDDVKVAEQVGRTAGRNEKIVTEKLKSDKMKKGDGLPDIEGGAVKEAEKKMDNADDLTKGLRQIVGKKSILGGGEYV